ncbi:hypothetical protein [Lacticaseibacillus paracasei]|uniref:hypothetical protein n=1 Tax=Lacticaseibacillus paracasei TaxID=1597 RepID=UPI0018AD318D|nr:hypothetical protein [Lacticaseibacillus paracasei]QPI89369.1 hypothetical protein I3F57_06405 [Lacticaseibacillus paracasei subsp. tolerans]
MSDFRITKRDEKEQSSDWMTLVHEEDNHVLIDVLSIAKSKIANAGIYLDREEVKTLVNWLDEFLYSTRENGTPALTEKTQQRKAGKFDDENTQYFGRLK